MAWSAPPAWATGNVVTAAKLTVVSDDLTYLEAPYEAWTSYTPTLTQSATVTKTVTYAKYTQFGKTVLCHGFLAVTGAGTASNGVTVGLPVTAASGGLRAIGSGMVFDTSAAAFFGGIAITASSTTTMQFLSTNGSVANVLGVTDFSAALASGDTVSWAITYEAA